MKPWLYNGAPITSANELPPKTVGFIYIITQLSTGRYYIGRKMTTKTGRKTTNGKTKKIRVENDWMTYWSSSPEINALIAANGHDDFTREILVFCKSKGSIAFCEEMALYAVGALEDDRFLNSNIRAKVFRNWVQPDEASALRSKLNLFKLIP